MAPRRIQLSRSAGWTKPEGAVVIARPTRWSNPISLVEVAAQYPRLTTTQVAALAVHDFDRLARHGVLSFPDWQVTPRNRGSVTWTYPSVTEIREHLAGRDLACWCPLNLPCHADVLLHIAAGHRRSWAAYAEDAEE